MDARSRAQPTIRRRSPWWRRASILLIAGAVTFLALGFTQFRFLREVSATGTAMLVMDVSNSMGRTDVEPNRLEAAKAAAAAFLDELPPGLKVGLVTFAGEANVLAPPTTELGDVRLALESLPRGRGTLIGDGLSAALDVIEAEWEQNGTGPAAVVLLSDGKDTGSAIVPDAAARRAAPLGVTVYTVSVGVAEGAGEEPGADVELLRGIAETTGGSTFSADTAGGLLSVYENLGTRLSTELAVSDYGEVLVGISAVLAIAATVTILMSLRPDPWSGTGRARRPRRPTPLQPPRPRRRPRARRSRA